MGSRIRRSPLFAAAVFGVLAALSGISESGPWSPTAVFAQSGASVNGVILITDRSGIPPNSPIPDTTVSLYSMDRILQTKSDQKGLFAFANVPSGTYILEATRPGFTTKNLGTIQVNKRSVGPFSITMSIANPGCGNAYSVSYAAGIAGRTLRGLLRDTERPLADADVSLATAVGTRLVASQRSTGKGEFEFADVEPGQYVLRVSHSRYHDQLTEPFWIVRESGTEIGIRVIKLGQMIVCQ
jgi:Carboxypeptidase regulatory-like domain